MIENLCNRCRRPTALEAAHTANGRLYATIHTELVSFDNLSGWLREAGWRVIQIDNLGRDMFLFTMVTV
jgi:hypothetical protein